MKLLRRGNSDTPDNGDHEVVESTAVELTSPTSETEGKGRPTPKRREAESKRRGPVAPAPLTAKEARARRKQTQGSKEERKQASAERRATAADRRARMLAGEDKYLLPRDKGPVRAYVRDLVDSRRHLVGLFMPLALLLIMAMFLSPAIQSIVTLGMLVLMLFMLAEGYIMGRTINRQVRERFPDTMDGGLKLGWYAFVRASQIRKMRAPQPRVSPGDAV
ncbi:hypothetical protein ABIC28_004702 [Rhodococcus sp. PvR044]|uniref:DUF3043 domain-containing protein n=1 Tax=Rhodococcus oryzae TaxID=2571143 RepID=A0ABY2RLY7_9NOCA|nr:MULTISPECIES: DUF3043 domain-containing protein [Rhodococcus]MCZ4556891.1 DUF3043 domain-containing protein [Rhodococcus maanshanensis]PTR41930.1 Protein of unknown function (DUF3043) [Rhodococcus sp. OK611]TJZ77786.1 DUF3043 domain-containing protein [Rhodococcus oryzae]SNX91623.1 Protein of unknown function [Rhodococcus sp. OK270]